MGYLFVSNSPPYNVQNLPFPDFSNKFHVHVTNHSTDAVYMLLEKGLFRHYSFIFNKNLFLIIPLRLSSIYSYFPLYSLNP